MLSVTLRQFEYVTAIWRHSSVSAAAATLNVSQPALSVALGQLEAELGKPLFFRRSGGPMVPTSFGRDFLESTARIVGDTERLMTGNIAEPGRPVVVGFFEDLAPLLLAPILSHLGQLLPHIRVHPVLGDFEDVSSGLGKSGRMDFAITYDLGLDDAYVRSELVRLPIQAVVSVDHPFAQAGAATMAEVASAPIIVTDQGLSKAHMLRVFSERGHRLSIAHMAGTMETMRSLAANGLGVGLSYTKPKSDTSYDGKPVRQVPIIDADTTEPIILVSHRENALSGNAERTREAIMRMVLEL